MVASPWLDWDQRKELGELLPFVASTKLQARALFFSYADEGTQMRENIDALTAALKSRTSASLRWGSATYPGETHDSTVIKSYFDGLRMIFAGFAYPRDPQTNFLQGSLDNVKAHYARFGERLGYTQIPPEEIVNGFGYQLLRTKATDQSLKAFRYNIELYPQSANAWDSLADALEQAGNKDEALASCRKAVSLAEANVNPNLETSRKHVAAWPIRRALTENRPEYPPVRFDHLAFSGGRIRANNRGVVFHP